MNVVVIIQARMGSTRLPGKVMLPLANDHVITHVIRRARAAGTVDNVVVATSTKTADDIVARYARRGGASVFRGSESDVLGRMYNAANDTEADVIVRITGDCPLVDPATIDAVIDPVATGAAEYAENITNRTFPRGLDVEAFTIDSFRLVEKQAKVSHHREHVTPYYRKSESIFDTVNITSDLVFEDDQFRDRTDLRLTLDEADDYELLKRVYESVPFEDILNIKDAIEYVDQQNIATLNEAVTQKKTK